jgi:MSHA biogenesis protein MshE
MAATPAARPKKVRIGDLLIAHKIISQEQLNTALAEQKKSGRKLGRVLIENGFITEDQMLAFLSQQLQVPYIDLRRYNYKPDVVRLLPETHARRFRAIVLEDSREGLMVGMADATDIFAYDEIARVLRRPLRLAVVKESDLLATIDRVYRRTEEISGLAQELEQELSAYTVDLGELAAAENLADAPVVKLLQSMFEDAVQVNASDIHIEPDERELRIRFRLDGVLRVQTTADRRIAGALVSRLKLMAGLDISEKRLPQDGRLNVRIREKNVDVRMSTMPVQYGESVVMRLLNQATGILKLDHVGMPLAMLKRFREIVHAPNGMVLVTGPTGSGKTTTLYGALSELNRPEFKILTVEDPVEYRLAGINQVQVNPRIELSFARVLRSMLRQDPDIILVGEMRDQETAEIGLRAAMTGHLVLSTLHTNDAPSAITRLLELGVAPHMLRATLLGVMAQRLVRTLCPHCRQPTTLEEPDWEALVAPWKVARPDTAYAAEGCLECRRTGFRGRIGLYESLLVSQELRRHISATTDVAELRQACYREGMHPLRLSGARKVAAGLTTVEEVLNVAPGADE